MERLAALGRVPHRDAATAPVTTPMEVSGILHLRADRPGVGQEARRAMLACDFATEPDVFLLDEPTADPNPSAAHAVTRLLREIAESGRCVVMVLAAGRITADLPAGEALPAAASAFGLPYSTNPALWLLPPV